MWWFVYGLWVLVVSGGFCLLSLVGVWVGIWLFADLDCSVGLRILWVGFLWVVLIGFLFGYLGFLCGMCLFGCWAVCYDANGVRVWWLCGSERLFPIVGLSWQFATALFCFGVCACWFAF